MAPTARLKMQDQNKAFTQPNKNPPERPRGQPEAIFYLPLKIVFCICLLSHILAAAYAPIPDCDEVFNFWEPSHYLSHGHGLQTWEYSPEYALRSWFYAGLHAVVGRIGFLLSGNKVFEFYFIRVALAVACATSETRLFSAISRSLNPRIGIIYLVITAFSPGIFQASIAFLPSSFAMYTSSLGLAAFMDWQGGTRTATGIMWFGIGATIGWPFASILAVPFVLEEFLLATMMPQGGEIWWTFLDGIVRTLIVMGLQFFVDLGFYREPFVVPIKLIFYNVFGGKDRGPNIFGTEPWTFYFKNLLLNFNIWFLLALAAAPFVFLQYSFRLHATTKQTLLRTCTFVTPFYLWLGIFTLQPHKEERFMYPAYPFLVINAAIAFHMMLAFVSSRNTGEVIGRIPAPVKAGVMAMMVLAAVNVGLLRIVGNVTAYHAPLEVYRALKEPGAPRSEETVCLGKEWYRFPSSYHLPNNLRPKFVKSEFAGLLPGEFNEANVGFGFYPGAWLVPSGMNDRNEEDIGKYTKLEHCSYLVDSYMPSSPPTELEPHYVLDEEIWEKVVCSKFLDVSQTSLLARTIWIPDLPILPGNLRRKWGDYCLLKRRHPLR